MSGDELKHFLLVYDVEAGRLRDVYEFGTDAKAAVAKYAQLEDEARRVDGAQLEIVLIGSDSVETIKATHGHYFSDETFERMAAL